MSDLPKGPASIFNVEIYKENMLWLYRFIKSSPGFLSMQKQQRQFRSVKSNPLWRPACGEALHCLSESKLERNPKKERSEDDEVQVNH